MEKKRNLFLLNSPLIFVELLTILLLTYIAYGEANRKFEAFEFGKMAAQAETIQNSMESHLLAGIPLSQFAGFNSLSEALIQSDQYIQSISIFDKHSKDPVFRNEVSMSTLSNFKQQFDISGSNDVSYYTSDSTYRVAIPLNGKFGNVGHIQFDVSTAAVKNPITEHFKQISIYNAIVFVIFTLSILIFAALSKDTSENDNFRKKIFNFIYLISFLVISGIIASSVFKIYEEGASAKTSALTHAMGQRVNAILNLGVNLDDIKGINEAFLQYQNNNPDINAIALTRDGLSVFHTDSNLIGTNYSTPDDSYEYSKTLNTASSQASWSLNMTIPTDIVTDAILDRVNEFLVLMLACGLISWIFLDAGTGLTQWSRHKSRDLNSEAGDYDNFEVGLRLIKPAYFIIVFTSALPVSFLPQLVSDMASQSNTSLASATLPFTIFYFVFAAVLIPAGRYAEKVELKYMMAIGFLTELIGLFLIATSDNYWMLTLGRAFSGFAQGVFLIGLNSYTMSITPREKRTQGAAVKVNGRNAALVSGTSIGALLYAYIDYQTIFIVAVIISLVGILYLWQLVPSVKDLISDSVFSSTRKKQKETKLKEDIIAVIKDSEFVKTLLFVGLIGKMAITGVIMFAIPLILTDRGMASEDIGQSIILFYIASIIVTRYAAKAVDRSGKSSKFLAFSSIIGGIGILLIGITGVSTWDFGSLFPGSQLLLDSIIMFNFTISQYGITNIEHYTILLGILLAGVSNGMMAAPIMTHIDKTPVAFKYGNKAVSATYLFLERGGHVTGPMVVSFMLLFTHQTTIGIALFGIATIIMSILFLFTSKQA